MRYRHKQQMAKLFKKYVCLSEKDGITIDQAVEFLLVRMRTVVLLLNFEF